MRAVGQTVAAWAHPGPNQVAFLVLPERGLVAVCDGLAGHSRGDRASALARDAVARAAAAVPAGESLARWCIARAREALLAARRQSSSDMTTTAVAAHLADGAVEVAWCGDSRAYELTEDRRLLRVTADHDSIYDLEMQGRIGSHRAEFLRLVLDRVETESEAWHKVEPRRSGLIAEATSWCPSSAQDR